MIETRRKSEYEGTTNRMINNYFKPTGTFSLILGYKPEGLRPTTGNQTILNQSLNMTPGYSTDREIGYVPKTIGYNYKAVNSTINH